MTRTLTPGRAVTLRALSQGPLTVETVAQRSGVIAWYARGRLRRLVEAGLVRRLGDRYALTAEGLDVLRVHERGLLERRLARVVG